jgi:hypothetical protein
MKRSALMLVLAAGVLVLLRKPLGSLINQLGGTVVRTEHRSDDGSVAHEAYVTPSVR